ncbi:MFS transporter [Desulfosporosinus sp. PR]|uniref:MFS transporter n=1 Tax=Candidatus Desulfosporosinus nitrosoreducens TaxID=3401928 RepID=UPI0027F1BA96|nr:MFS transporter [Desulfosporosinus sp. PR]MDQ7096513.1 MFS transporter [Desulfosporosinus sp. PR]
MSMLKTNYRWFIIFMVFIITMVNYVDRSAIAFAMPLLSKQFHMTPEDIGLTLGAFNIGYAIMVFIGGLMVDRWGSRKIWMITALVWSLSILSTAAAAGFAMLYTVRLILGLAEGPNFPALNRVVGDWLPGKERALALGNALVGVPLALAFGGLIVAFLANLFSWRGMFIILGALGIIWAPIWYFCFRDFPENSGKVNDAELKYIKESDKISRNSERETRRQSHASKPGMWKFLLTNPTLLSNDWAFFVFGYNLFFFMGWLPTFLNTTYHMNLSQVGSFTFLPWITAAIMLYLVGVISNRILKSTGKYRLARSHPLWITQLLGAICLLPILYYHSVGVALLSISLCVGFNMAPNTIFYAVNIDIIKERSGTAMGITDLFFAVAGLIAATLTGFIIQVSGSFQGAFILVIVLNISSVIGVILFHNPDRENSRTQVTQSKELAS